jgi:succinate-semialdehyde dehydrogenase/glutarate-semialdehyde dehydrogenase
MGLHEFTRFRGESGEREAGRWPRGWSSLLEILLDTLSLPEQERDVNIRGLDEAVERFDGGIELLFKLCLLLIPPTLRERSHPRLDGLHVRLEFGVESLEILRESTKFGRIGDGLGHDMPPEGFGKWCECTGKEVVTLPGTGISTPEKEIKMMESNLIGGRWVGADSGETFEVSNPATDQVVGRVPNAGADEARRAVDAAFDALPGWAARTAIERAEVLETLSARLAEDREELAALLTEEQGKPLAESRAEIDYGRSFFEVSAKACQAIRDEMPLVPGKKVRVHRRPVGVAAAITPWNFPMAMLAKKMAPAMAVGCTQVLKPAEQTPLSAIALLERAMASGVPAGVLNLVTGDPAAIGAAWLEDPRVRKLSFTGSTEVGRILMRGAATNLQRLSLELGGHAPMIVFEDASVDLAVDIAMAAKFRNGGQTCICPNRFLIHRDLHDRFASMLAIRSAALISGRGHDPGIDLGPMIDDRAIEKVEAHVADAVKLGATLVTGGGRRRMEGLADRFFEPTVLTGCTSRMRCWNEETFGPVCPIRMFDDESEALAVANDSSFGLASYVVTNDQERIRRLGDDLHTGIIGVNDPGPAVAGVPFGGVKHSGFGREGGRWGLEEYLELVTVSSVEPAAE